MPLLFGFGGVAFALVSGKPVRGLGETGLTRWGGMLLAVSLLSIGLSPTWVWAIPACFLAGKGFYMRHSPQFRDLSLHADAGNAFIRRRKRPLPALVAVMLSGMRKSVQTELGRASRAIRSR